MMTIAGILLRRGSIRLAGGELVGLSPARIVARGSRWCRRTGWFSRR